MAEASAKYPEGTLVTMPAKHGDTVFTVDEPWIAEDTGEVCYYLSNENYMGLDGEESELRQFMTAEDASKRRLPTPDEFAKAYNWLNDPWDGEFTLHASDPEGDGRVTIAGRTAEGMLFAAQVIVVSVKHADF